MFPIFLAQIKGDRRKIRRWNGYYIVHPVLANLLLLKIVSELND